MVEGGIGLLSMTAAEAEDPQTLRMVAGAIANLCGNGMLHSLLFFLCFIVNVFATHIIKLLRRLLSVLNEPEREFFDIQTIWNII